MKLSPRVSAALLLAAACSKPQGGAEPQRRADVRVVDSSTVEIVPAANQLPFCLVYTVSERGVTRQLTMNRNNESIPCEAGQPVAKTSFRIPAEEGRVRVYVFFSDSKLKASSLAEQLYTLSSDGRPIQPLDLRLPGKVFVETLEFDPKEANPAMIGSLIGQGGLQNTPPPGTPEAGTGGSPPAALPADSVVVPPGTDAGAPQDGGFPRDGGLPRDGGRPTR